MPLTRDEVEHIAVLCRIGLTLEEMDVMQHELSQILEQFKVLDRLKTDMVAPTTNSVGLMTIMREDRVRPGLDEGQVLANAPQRAGQFFKVRAVLEEKSE